MLSSDQIGEFKIALTQLKSDLLVAIDMATTSAEPVQLDQSLVGRVSRGDAMQQQQMAAAGLAANKKRLRVITQALTRIEEDEYGDCLECGEEIPIGRLKIFPEAAHCIQCAEKTE